MRASLPILAVLPLLFAPAGCGESRARPMGFLRDATVGADAASTPLDAGVADLDASSAPDATPADAAPRDATAADAAPSDATPTDATPTDATPTDAAVTDAALTDAASVDSGAFNPPPGTVEVGFSVDDSANQTYRAADRLAWKGAFTFDATTRRLTPDPGWGGGIGPYPLLYDDGPWSAGGHEPAGASAMDGIWGVATFLPIPSQDVTLEYGAVDNWSTGQLGNWIWTGPNGAVTVTAGATGAISAPGLTIPAHGQIDLRALVDANQLAAGWPTRPSFVTMRGSMTTWRDLTCTDDGTLGDTVALDSVFTCLLSAYVGPGTALPHQGLLRTGTPYELAIRIDGQFYQDAGMQSHTTGVTLEVRPAGGAWTPVTPVVGQNLEITP